MDHTKLTNEERAKLGYSTIPGSFNSATGNLITYEKLKSNEPLKLPKDQYTPLVTDFSLEKSALETEQDRLKNEKKSQESNISSLLKDIGIVQGQEADIATQLGADKAQQDFDRYSSELESERRALDLITREIQTAPTTKGQANARLADVQRISYQKQADIAILGNAAKGRFDTAMSIAKRKVDSTLIPLKTELEAKRFIYDNNKDIFSKAELSKLDGLIKAEERVLAKEEKTLGTIENIKIEAVKNGLKDTSGFSNIKTVDDALRVAGGYLMSPKEKLELQKLNQEISKNAIELLNAKQTLGGTSGDPVLDIISASSRYGDKRLTDSQLEKIQKATTALGGMETLQGLLSQGKDGLSLTGPLKGRARNLISQLGGDADARAINATIQGLIPTIARGIFGEVGVLTDADINNYKKTVPNIVSTEDQNKLVSIIMYDVLSRSLKSTLTSNAQNQTNVSGFANTYTDVNNRVNKLKSELGVVEPIAIDPVNKAKLDTAWGTQFSPENITNSLNNFLEE